MTINWREIYEAAGIQLKRGWYAMDSDGDVYRFATEPYPQDYGGWNMGGVALLQGEVPDTELHNHWRQSLVAGQIGVWSSKWDNEED